MLLRRITQHLKAENWVALALDLVIVVVGIFIAIQVDRWYESRREKADETAHLSALASDFAATRAEIEEVIADCAGMMRAALVIRNEARKEKTELSADELNALLTELSLLPFPRVIRSGYENLVSSGRFVELRNKDLVAQINQFYERVRLLDRVIEAQASVYYNTFQPYVVDHLDFAPLVRSGIAPPGVRQRLEPYSYEANIVIELSTMEFQNVVVAKWQSTRALQSNLEGLLMSIVDIEAILAAEIARK